VSVGNHCGQRSAGKYGKSETFQNKEWLAMENFFNSLQTFQGLSVPD
jgi:hypothetical protein